MQLRNHFLYVFLFLISVYQALYAGDRSNYNLKKSLFKSF